ncbi:MAG: ABC transporter substrate-binding protein [Holosporales bacterium]|jgi:putative ABC transport system substrate-binding protein|nr:ABC transporter substrate-binding protein [Holosporales bacterium]
MSKGKMTLVASIVLCGVFCWGIFLKNKNADRSENKAIEVISVCKVIEHEALDSVVRGIQDYLSGNNNVKFEVDTCQSNQALASQIMSKFANSKRNIVITVGTMPTQIAAKYAEEKRIKLIFSSVTNPSTVPSLENTTGVSNFVALKPQIELFKKIQPNLRKLGIIYNTGEANSVDIVEQLRPITQTMGIELVEQGIQKASDIPQAVNALIQNVDAIFISNDNTALCAIPYIVDLCSKVKIPVYVSDTDQVEKGCLAALGPNQYEIGKQTGTIAERILKGQDINSIPIEYPSSTELLINLDTAKKLEITIPEEVLRLAKKVIETGK